MLLKGTGLTAAAEGLFIGGQAARPCLFSIYIVLVFSAAAWGQ